MKRAARRPTVLVAAGWEGSGRVGVLADVAAIRAAGGAPAAVVTALTAQGRGFACLAVPNRFLLAQLEAALADGLPAAAKLGLVPHASALAVLWPALLRLGIPLVVDPVVRSSRGEALSLLTPRDFRRLAGPNVWLTPNVPELAWLLGHRSLPKHQDAVAELATALWADGFGAVVVKGVHLGGRATDVLVTKGRVVRLSAPRLKRDRSRRGTGCRFASTLAARLALGQDGTRAVRDSKGAVRRYLRGLGP